MTPELLAKEKIGSTAGTNAVAALGLQLSKWTGVLSGAGFIAAVSLRMETLALGILGLWLGYLAAFRGITMVQHTNDRKTDYGLVERQMGYPTPEDGRSPGAASSVTKEKTTTTAQTTTVKDTKAPATEEVLG